MQYSAQGFVGMKRLIFAFSILVAFLFADCQRTVLSFLQENHMKKIHLKIMPWTKLESKIEHSHILKDKRKAKKCILKLNPKYPFNDKV